MSEATQRKETQKWAIEKPKFDNARRLRGIYFIDPEDATFKEIYYSFFEKKKRRKLEALLILARQKTNASLKPTNLRESVWKELCIKI